MILQRALLPESLPEVEGIEFAARYEPAAPGLEVGGDWYEVVPCDDGTFGITIGDVAGRGIRAASTMGRLRPALRGFVADGHPPAEVMRRLDSPDQGGRAAGDDHGLPPPLRPARRGPASTCAPDIRRRCCGSPTAGSRSCAARGPPPLGILPELEFAVHRVEIPPGSLLLLYTDGLIERRGDDLDGALGAAARRSLAGCPGGAAGLPRRSWRATLRDRAVPDDVAMLAMAVAGTGL